MNKTVFVDGQHGTTGLKIRERLTDRSDIEIIDIPEDVLIHSLAIVPAGLREVDDRKEFTYYHVKENTEGKENSAGESIHGDR